MARFYDAWRALCAKCKSAGLPPFDDPHGVSYVSQHDRRSFILPLHCATDYFSPGSRQPALVYGNISLTLGHSAVFTVSQLSYCVPAADGVSLLLVFRPDDVDHCPMSEAQGRALAPVSQDIGNEHVEHAGRLESSV
jgi:hypothetical protein